MRFLVDECTGPAVATALSALGHDVLSAYDMLRGAGDGQLLQRALREQRVLITNDKDFGDRVFRDAEQHAGVVLLRLENNSFRNRVERVLWVVAEHGETLVDTFTVVTDHRLRRGLL